MCVCVWVCVCARECACARVCVCVCVRASVCVHIPTYTHANMHANACLCAQLTRSYSIHTILHKKQLIQTIDTKIMNVRAHFSLQNFRGGGGQLLIPKQKNPASVCFALSRAHQQSPPLPFSSSPTPVRLPHTHSSCIHTH